MVLDGSHRKAETFGRGDNHREHRLPVLDLSCCLCGGQLTFARRRGEEFAQRLKAEKGIAQCRLTHDLPRSLMPLSGIRVDRIEQDVGVEAEPLNAHRAHPARGLGLQGDGSG